MLAHDSTQQLPESWCCVDVQFSIEEFMKDFGLNGSICAGASVPSLGYNGIVPGPLMQRTQCVVHCCLVYPMLHTTGTSTVHRSDSLSHLAPAFHPAFMQPPQSPYL